MYPWVSAWDGVVQWNSPNCGKCIRLQDQSTGAVIYVTAIDHCDPLGIPNTNTHLDISEPAFTTLFGNQGIHDGHGLATWSVVASSNCQGNLG